MDSQIHLLATTKQAVELMEKIRVATARCQLTGEAEPLSVILEQAGANGPWRLTLSICPEED